MTEVPPVDYLDEVNPYGALQAVLQDDGRVVVLYLYDLHKPENLKALWVANRVPAPDDLDVVSMDLGLPPIMHRDACSHPDGLPAFDPERLSLTWFEEGDGLVVFQDDDIIAVMPPWAGVNGFSGHSTYATAETSVAWPLEEAARETFDARALSAELFWEWRLEEDSWTEIQDAGMAFLEARLGPHKRYWAVGQDEFPTVAVVLFQPPAFPDVSIYATVGMSAQPMPQVEMAHDDPAPYRRIELAIATVGEQDWAPRALGAFVRFPWTNGTWLGDRHTVNNAVADDDWRNQAILFLKDPLPRKAGPLLFRKTEPAPDLSGLTDRSGDPVTFLWLMGISGEDKTIAELNGSARVIEDLKRLGRSWVNWNG